MIVSLRGTNGAGKSTIVRRVMEHALSKKPITEPDRRKPLGYTLTMGGNRKLFVVGHYEIANGGVDTIKTLDRAYDMVYSYHEAGFDVIFEGKNMSDGITRVRMLPRESTAIILVDHPVDECVRAVRERGHSIVETTIQRIDRKVRRDVDELEQLGFQVYRLQRTAALEKCLSLLAPAAKPVL